MNIDGFDIDENQIPKHIAIIMDGNGRWAKRRNLNRIHGHRKGVDVLIDILKISKDIKLNVLSVFAFSTENWNRPKDEVSGLMNLFVEFFSKKFKKIKKENIKVIHTGILDNLSEKVKNVINRMTKETVDNTGSILNLVFNYGGRIEIVDASKRIAECVKNQKLDIDDINEKTFNSYLYHPEITDPDLLIRTSGEQRISNFLLWELAYSEFWFTDKLWPDFKSRDFIKAISDYQQRERRFGKVK